VADKNAIELSIGLRADDSQLAGDIARIKAKVDKTDMPVDAGAAKESTKATEEAAKKVEELGEKTKKAGEKGKESFGGLGDTLRDAKKKFGEQIEVVQGLIGKLTAVGMVAATFYKIGEAISTAVIENLKTATDKANEFIDALEINKPVENAQKLQPELDKINQQLEEQVALLADVNSQLAAGRGAMYLYEQRAKYEKEILELQKARAQIEGKLTTELAQKNAQEASKRRAQEQKDAADKERKMQDLADAQQALDARTAYDRMQKLQEENQDRMDSIAEIWNKQKQAQLDVQKAAEQAARATREAWVKALRDIRNESNQLFASDQANSLTQLASQFQTQTITAQAGLNRIYVEGVG
jgi:hypothetical protein